MADQSGGGLGSPAMLTSSSAGGLVMREYRKGNWTLQETMILIEAKKMDDERRLKRSASTASATSSSDQQYQLTTAVGSGGSLETRSKRAELRWKWVEDYCWRRGCFRSQNQCNDKWDNLMRDYKKVRDHQRKILETSPSSSSSSLSYWNMDKSQRKERGLPSNMLPTIYDALLQVVDKKSSPAITTDVVMSVVHPTLMQPQPAPALSLLHQQHINASAALPLPLSFQPPPRAAEVSAAQPISIYQPTIADHGLDSDTSSDSPAKRRRKDKGPESTAGPSSSNNEAAAGVVASAISIAASRISEAIQSSDARQDQRHREMVRLSQRRLEIEESRMSGLVEAINNLSNSILALAASDNINNRHPPEPRPP